MARKKWWISIHDEHGESFGSVLVEDKASLREFTDRMEALMAADLQSRLEVRHQLEKTVQDWNAANETNGEG